MDSDLGKIFVGGISWETSEEKLKEYFSQFGEVAEVVIMKDRTTGRARGFGFVVFSDPSVADKVLLDKHTIDGRQPSAPPLGIIATPAFLHKEMWHGPSGG
eukprot:TRINITY_DN2615_c0_g1_i1.p3 TRINITY_DN2615_c0_g1~~TRINITY_DN2615_c0_g1_i1.p3  ORF type:complete len:101 (-),score=18.94 TRINITY_DN2615_c0_g1_i1:117-419(-)